MNYTNNSIDRTFMAFTLENLESGSIKLRGDCWQGNHFKTVVTIHYNIESDSTTVRQTRYQSIKGEDLIIRYKCCQGAIEEAIRIKLLNE